MRGESSIRQTALHGDDDVFALPSLTTAAHELKTPLALIRQHSLALQTGDEVLYDLANVAAQIELTAERSLRLIDDLTRVSSLEDALFELEPVNPVALCDEVVAELLPLYRAKGREIRTVRRKQPPLVVANRNLLRRVITNFADNALHYADDSYPVELTARMRGDHVRISVRDFGPGVDAGLRRLVQADASRPASASRRPASSGLGLYISRQFANAMNARVGVSRHRDGASFFIELHGSTQMSLL